MTRILLIFILLGLFSDFVKSKSCDSKLNYYTLNQCLNGNIKENARYLFNWLYFNKQERGTFNENILMLEEFKDILTKGDYFYYKGIIYNTFDRKEEAITFFKKSDLDGNPQAGMELYNELIFTNKNEAYKYLTSAAEKGFSDAQFALANLMLKGVKGYVEKNVQEAVRYLELTALDGKGNSISRLVMDDVYILLNKQDKLFWKLTYNLYESESFNWDRKKMKKIDWGYFCKKYIKFSPDENVKNGSIDNVRYTILKQIIISCSTR